jgi:hypothetical protein
MTIDEEGFLSPKISGWIEKHRAENRAWFAHAMDLNSVAQRLLLEVPLDNETLPFKLFFVRGLSSFQAAILLAERGMTQDARTIIRSCFETVFVMALYATTQASWRRSRRPLCADKRNLQTRSVPAL